MTDVSLTIDGGVGGPGSVGGFKSGGVQTSSDSPVSATSGAHYFTDTSSGGVTVNLPGSPNTGWAVQVAVKDASNTTTVDGNGNNIEGSSSVTLTSQYASETYRYNGTEWQIV